MRLSGARINEDKSSVALEIENAGYAVTDAVHKALSIAELHLPVTVDFVEVLLREEGQLGPTLVYKRREGRIVGQSSGYAHPNTSPHPDKRIRIMKSKRVDAPTNLTNYHYPFLNLGGDLSTRTQLMDPDAFFAKQLYLKLSARLSLLSTSTFGGFTGKTYIMTFRMNVSPIRESNG